MSSSGSSRSSSSSRGSKGFEVLPAVLIVDDVEANLVAMRALLEELECEIVCASSGNEALRLLLHREFAAVLLDVQMPEMDGFEVARLARMNPTSRQVPIIFVTAMLETEEGLFRGYESGAVDVLFKPLNRHILLSKVRVFLELDRSKRKLESVIRAHERTLAELDAFNYSVSHDLRAPLRPLNGFSKVLLDDYGDRLDDSGRHLLVRIGGAALRMEQIIEELLRLSKISRTQVRIARVDLTALAHAVIADIRLNDPRENVEIVIASAVTVDADSELLRIALENLFRNAWKFTSKVPKPRIELGTHASHFFVSDNGVGFDPAHATRLFRAFQRLHPASEFEGTGIGLAIVHRIIEHHGGRVWADAKPNEGATFSFTLGEAS